MESGAETRHLDDIVECANSRNARLGVTGALVFTGAHFAQYLEGPQDTLDELLVSIQKDERHQDIRLYEILPVNERRFEGWSLAYAGPSLYVASQIDALLEGRHAPTHASKLLRLMEGFADEKRLLG